MPWYIKAPRRSKSEKTAFIGVLVVCVVLGLLLVFWAISASAGLLTSVSRDLQWERITSSGQAEKP
jgi:hypothetical protein